MRLDFLIDCGSGRVLKGKRNAGALEKIGRVDLQLFTLMFPLRSSALYTSAVLINLITTSRDFASLSGRLGGVVVVGVVGDEKWLDI